MRGRKVKTDKWKSQINYERGGRIKPLCSGRNEAYRILRKFELVDKSREEFQNCFVQLSEIDIDFLKSFYGNDNMDDLFDKICVFFNVKS